MGEQGGGRESLSDRPLRGRRLVDGPAGPATVTRAADPDDPKPRRHMVKHLADGLANHMQRAAAAVAGLTPKIEPNVLARQVRRQAWPLRLRSRRFCLCWRKPGFGSRKIGVEILEAEPQLLVIEPLGLAAELAALQLLDDEPEPFDLGLGFAEAGALHRERAHHALQRRHVVRQRGKIDVHGGGA